MLMLAPSAHATFPGANGKIAFVRGSDIWVMNADGSGQVNLTNSPDYENQPVWSPDGARLAFSRSPGSGGEIWTMNPDGSNQVNLGNGVTPDHDPAWSPDGAQIAHAIQNSLAVMNSDGTDQHALQDPEPGDVLRTLDWSPEGGSLVFTIRCYEPSINAFLRTIAKLAPVTTAGSVTQLSHACPGDATRSDEAPSWSPDAQRILFTRRSGNTWGLYTMKPDGSDQQPVTPPMTNAIVVGKWSPDGSKIVVYRSNSTTLTAAVMRADGTGETPIATDAYQLDWQPLPVNAYPRPRGASPLQISLVPAYEPCTSANSTHGAPLAFGSCTPPDLASAHLTTGTPDANGRSVRMSAELTFRVVTGDVHIDARLNDVANQDLSDYTGSLRGELPVQITDKLNTPHPGGPGAATTQPLVYGFTIPCATNPGPTTGSDCTLATTMNALAPGTHADGRRAVWQLGQVRVLDGGADADGSTTGDNTVFAVEGVFVP